MRKTFGNMKIRVSRLAGDVSNDGKARAGECINDALEYIQGEREWSFLKDVTATITLVADQDTYDSPSGMFNIRKIYYTDGNDKVSRILRPCEDEDWLRYYEGQTSGNPSVYRLLGQDTTNYQLKLQIGVAPSANHISVFGTSLYIEQGTKLTELTADTQYGDLPGEFTPALEYLAASLMCASQGEGYQSQAVGYMNIYGLMIRPLKLRDLLRYGKLFPFITDNGPNSWRGRGRTDY